MTPTRLPMFPLGTVLFPHAYLPLHVFEPRYRRLTSDCLAGDRRFGVVLIERGSEVGGGDQRTAVGTVAEIVHAVEEDDGRWLLAAVGRERLLVSQWLPDDPYPRAEVEPAEEGRWGAEADAALVPAERSVRRALALLTELGEPSPPLATALSPDPVVASWQLADMAPLGAFDRQALLAVNDPADRLAQLTVAVDDACSVLAYRLAQG